MLKFLCLIALLGCATCFGLNATEEATDSEVLGVAPSRQGRRSSLASTCTTLDGFTGTCKSRFACMREGGTMKGYCSGGYGICCETNMESGDVSSLKRTIIRNTSILPPNTVEYIIAPYSSKVCQLRIDFERFELAEPQLDPDSEGMMCVDFLEVGRFSLCGSNNGQHLYLPFNGANSDSRIPLRFHLNSDWKLSAWSLIVTQLECPVVKAKYAALSGQSRVNDLRTMFASHHGNADAELLAPIGCDQYYTGLSGSIKSFNYNPGMGSVYVPDMNYVICVKSPVAPSMIVYTLKHFALAQGSTGNYDESCHTNVPSIGRPQDYMTIPQSSLADMTNVQPIFYCGELTEGLQIQAFPPFIMYFTSDKIKRDGQSETGFLIDYAIRTVYRG